MAWTGSDLEARATSAVSHTDSDACPSSLGQHNSTVQSSKDLHQSASCISTEAFKHVTPHKVTESTPCGVSTEEHLDSKEELSGSQYKTSESAPLLGDKDTEVYARRWYVLVVFSLSAAIQGWGWATWGPITQSSKAVFAWTDANVALQPLWGNLAFIFAMVPAIWLMDVKGQ